jgi:hypothetical protein
MRGYLEYLAPQMGDLPGQLEEAFTHLRGEATEKATVKTRHSRLNEAISHLHLGLNSFLSFAVSQGAISQEAISQEEGKKILGSIPTNQRCLRIDCTCKTMRVSLGMCS